MHRIGGLEKILQDFEKQRRKILKRSKKHHSFGDVALENYVKFHFDKEHEIEKILTENLKKICFTL